jgi:hypothetical protein
LTANLELNDDEGVTWEVANIGSNGDEPAGLGNVTEGYAYPAKKKIMLRNSRATDAC